MKLPRYQFICLLLLLVASWVIAYRFNMDFLVFYRAGAMKWNPIPPAYVNVPNEGKFFYAPVSLLLFKPFGLLGYPVAKLAWNLIQTLSFIGFWAGLYFLYPFLGSVGFVGWVVIFSAAINPIHNNFQTGNVQLMLAAILVWAEIGSRSRSPAKQILAGAACAFVGVVKVFPLLMTALYFVTKPKKVKQGLVLGLVLAFGLPFLVFGIDGSLVLYRGFMANILGFDERADNSLVLIADILCLPSWLMRLGFSRRAAAVLDLGVCLSFFLWLFRNRSRWSREWDTSAWAIGMLLMVFLNFSTRVHYFVFYLPAFCSLLALALVREPGQLVRAGALALATLCIAFTAQGVAGRYWSVRFEVMSIPTFGAAVLAVALTWSVAAALRRDKLKIVS